MDVKWISCGTVKDMPRLAKVLTIREVNALSTTKGFHSVGGVSGLGLLVRVQKDGAFYQRWVLRNKKEGNTFEYVLGKYPDMSLGQARDKAAQARAAEINPIEARKAEKARREEEKARIEAEKAIQLKKKPFKEVAELAIHELACAAFWKDTRSEQRERARLAKHIFPHLENTAIQDISPRVIAEVFNAPELRELSVSSLSKVKAILGKVFDYAARKELIEESPMQTAQYRSFLSSLPKPQKETRHHGALTPEEMPEFFRALVLYVIDSTLAGVSNLTAVCLLYSILTALRSDNARGTRWSEFNLTAKTQTISKQYMKQSENGDHQVFLSSQALDIIQHMPKVAGTPFVFVSSRGSLLSENSFSVFVRKFNAKRINAGLPPFVDKKQIKHGNPIKVTQHGLARATYKTWTQTASNEQGLPLNVDAVKLSLHHKRIGAGGLGGAYERADFVEERRAISQQWASYCLSAVTAKEWNRMLELLGGY